MTPPFPPKLASAAALALLVSLGGCVSGSGPSGPVISPTGIVYEPGTPPAETRFSQTAALYLRTDEPHRALAQAREGIEEDPENPIHYFLAGVASTRIGEWEEADRLLARAQEIYPAYELDIEPEREAAWAEAFNEGSEAYAEAHVDEAIEAWYGAIRMYDLRAEAHRNLGMLLSTEGRYEEAADVLQAGVQGLEREPATRVLEEEEVESRRQARWALEESLADVLLLVERFQEAEPLLRSQLDRDGGSPQLRQNLAAALTGQGNREEAREIYDGLLSEGEMEATQVFNLGVALFRAQEYQRAGEAFRRLTELRPRSRDAWFNYLNALFAGEAWEQLVDVSASLLELDPLNENVGLIAARALLEVGDEEGAARGLDRVEELPVYVEGLIFQTGPAETQVLGRVTGNVAEAGTTVSLRFTFHDDGKEVGRETVTVSAPAPGESRDFEVVLSGRATGFSYAVLEPPL